MTREGVLIVPSGIETEVSEEIKLPWKEVLIVPSGIETIKREKYCDLLHCINCT